MIKKATPSAHDSSDGLGASLRERRKAKGLTLQAVADGAGLTTGFISQVERDIAAPSLASLTSIADVLGAHVSEFLQPPQNPDKITREGLREGYAVPGATLRYERLSTTFPGSQLTALVLHYPPGYRSEPMRHRGEELYYLTEGELTVQIGDEATILRVGDSIHFDSRRLHHTWNHTDQTTSMIVCNTMDVFGEDDSVTTMPAVHP